MTHKKAFEQAKKFAKLHADAVYILCELEQKEYGFQFADTDDDEMIDCLNYGQYEISFAHYRGKMLQYRKQNQQTGDFGIVLP